ncbi:GTP cyclohydrolase II [Streptomyces sp. B-S-A8]|uniref:GTP cyclohydrolase II n=1 Tax=Streptomyces solicavernae TaxID=3043614 RepID=A0ABT6RYQ9_9ACTN|nr:GTP cyclohydrolase II [Streptomyces sp. B-S-A8]MDI3389571.1 GTP cyclohydrolase II [Streptomyces sp. B-S-A8]
MLHACKGKYPETDADSVSDPARTRAVVEVPVRLADGGWSTPKMVTFHGLGDGLEHIALVFEPTAAVPLVRLHSECLTGDVFGSARCDCGPQLTESLQLLATEGGILLYLRQEGRGIGLYNKLDAYRLQDQGLDTFAANRELNFPDDLRDYRSAAQMLLALDTPRIRLHTNNPDKAAQLRACGIDIEEAVPTGIFRTSRNAQYLRAKAVHSGHTIDLVEELI